MSAGSKEQHTMFDIKRRVAIVACLLPLSGCAVIPLVAAGPRPPVMASSSPSVEAPSDYSPDNSDVTLTFKQKSKKCYSYGIGCSVTGEVRIKAYTVVPPDTGTITIYYRLKGDEDGPIDGVLEAEANGTESTYTPDYQYLSTASRDTKIKVTVTQIEYLS